MFFLLFLELSRKNLSVEFLTLQCRQRWLRSSSAPRCVKLWKGYTLTSAPHCPCSTCLRFSHIQIFITIWIKPWFSVHSARELRQWYWCYIVSHSGQAIRKGMQRNINWLAFFLFFFVSDGLKIAIKVLDTDLYLFHSFFPYPHIQILSVSNQSLWILACRRKKKKEN